MPRKCSSGLICFQTTTCLLIFFLIGTIIYILLQKTSNSVIRQVIRETTPSPPAFTYQYNLRSNYENPYVPPLRNNPFFARHIGVPINIPTQTVDTNYSSTGILTRIGGKETILPLFGRPVNYGRDKWQYYAMSDKNSHIKLPISQNGKSCTGEYGCDSLCNGDTVYIEGYNDAFKVTIYENNAPRYIPYI